MMMQGHTELSKDTRPIRAIWFLDGEEGLYSEGWQVGDGLRGGDTVMKIVAYDEHGEMGCVPWVAVVGLEGVALRMPARNIAIDYLWPLKSKGEN